MIRKEDSPELSSFRAHVVGHERLLWVAGRVKAGIIAQGNADFIFCPGPAGVGKSTFLRSIYRDLVGVNAYPEPGHRPVLSILVPGQAGRGFSVTEFYYEILEALGEPGIRSKVGYPPAGEDVEIPRRRRGMPEWLAKSACVQALLQHRVELILLDESQHLCKAGGPVRIEGLVDSIKYLVLRTGIRFVLLGTYTLRHMVDVNGELQRRSSIVHFSRYNDRVPADVDAFVSVVQNFQTKMPIPTPSLVDLWPQLYDASHGRVGSLKNLLDRALEMALAQGREMSLRDLRDAQEDPHALAHQLKEIMAGERRFSEASYSETDEPDALQRPPASQRRTPFKPRPKRYPVGLGDSSGI
jgi:hypothetical protein